MDMNAPMSQYWPAFAANGKEGITVVSEVKQNKSKERRLSLLLNTSNIRNKYHVFD